MWRWWPEIHWDVQGGDRGRGNQKSQSQRPRNERLQTLEGHDLARQASSSLSHIWEVRPFMGYLRKNSITSPTCPYTTHSLLKMSLKVHAPSNFRQKGNFDDSLQKLIVKWTMVRIKKFCPNQPSSRPLRKYGWSVRRTSPKGGGCFVSADRNYRKIPTIVSPGGLTVKKAKFACGCSDWRTPGTRWITLLLRFLVRCIVTSDAGAARWRQKKTRLQREGRGREETAKKGREKKNTQLATNLVTERQPVSCFNCH